MRNILYISLFGQIGGGEVSLLSILKNLDRSQFSPCVISYTDGPLIKRIQELNIDVSIFNSHCFLKDLMVIIRIIRYIKKYRIDLLHVNSLDMRSGIAAYLSGVPFIGHLRVIFPFTWRDCLFVGLSRKVIAVSKAVVEEFTKRFVGYKDKFIIIPNAVEAPGPIVPAGLRQEYSLNKDVLLIGSVGRIDPWKGYEYFIESAYLLKKEIPGAVFFIIGDIFIGNQAEEDYLTYLKKRVSDLNMREYFYFTGFKENIFNVIAALDILVIPSIEIKSKKGLKTEGFGRIAIEGMAIGVPVVASDIGGLREIIEDGVSGILVQSKNPEAIKEAVKKILSDADLRDSIISEGIKKVEQFYTVQRQLELITGLYIKILIRDSDYFSIDIMKKNSRCP
ncbi:MAG: glycosyltransferase family 4 protein [Candidatus Omnitrophota bacterium]|nr:glycosyltransferase family 4 protein [Candidatus Omnitrophota bacterium]MBU1928486.1 glycosyltransferase family 4 protein [Candidatus Omnitrophota bacterium]MBU2035441.1 glycosyltransferase family 4 protein [Candidatus Omnitrophota bacterium]MBU2257956.1 glycosyltransferase family 4 protein [Candidatus Omnitrophota bacterium]